MIREVLTPKSWLRRNAAPLAVFSGLVLGGFVGVAALEAHRSKPAPVAPSLTDVTSGNYALTMQGSTTLGDSVSPYTISSSSNSLTLETTMPLNDCVHYDACVTLLGVTGCTPAKPCDPPTTVGRSLLHLSDGTLLNQSNESIRIGDVWMPPNTTYKPLTCNEVFWRPDGDEWSQVYQIPSSYHCTKAQRGWECVREGR